MFEPIDWIDEQILAQYTKLGKRLNLDEGKKRYVSGMALWFAHVGFTISSGPQLIGPLEFLPRMLLNLPDFNYNLGGILGEIDEEVTSEVRVINPYFRFYKKINSTVRLPIFIAGGGLVGKFGIDLYEYIITGKPIEPYSISCLEYGIGLLSLSSSMYIKDIDPKLLGKDPVWERLYNWTKEKLSSLSPQPVPRPVSAQSLMNELYQC